MSSKIRYNKLAPTLTLQLRSPDRNADEETDSFTSTYHVPVWLNKPRFSTTCTLILWVLAFFGIFWMGFAAAMVYNNNKHAKLFGTYEVGFETEHVLPSSIIEIEQRRFTGGVEFAEDGAESLVFTPGEPIYVGEPSDEIDQAWSKLIDGRYFSISEREARAMWKDDYMLYRDNVRGGFTGGFDFFHSLHCINQLRMALRRDYYPEQPLHGMLHQLHCIDHLRQALMCSGSATITPTRWRPGLKAQYIESEQLQTCRSFKPIRDYTWERYNGSLTVPRI